MNAWIQLQLYLVGILYLLHKSTLRVTIAEMKKLRTKTVEEYLDLPILARRSVLVLLHCHIS